MGKDVEGGGHSDDRRGGFRQLFETTMEQSPFAMWIADPTGTVIRTNRALRRTLNLTDEQIVGAYNVLADVNLIEQGIMPQVRAVFEQAKATSFVMPGEASKGGSVDFEGGRDLWIEVTMFPVLDDGGELRNVVCQWVDISDLKNAERELRSHRDRLEEEVERRTEELRRSNADLERVASVASHDLQEPLRMVSSFLTLLSRRYGDSLDDRGRKYVEVAVDGAERMQHLIHDLLAYSRVDAEKGPVRGVDCRAVVGAALANLRVAIEEHGADVSVGELPRVRANAILLTQAFQNLLANALKFRGENPPRIEIRAIRADDRWEIRVADNGIGIAPEFHEGVFAVFRRLHARHEYEGSGLGLSVVKKIVERFDGTVRVESELGRGATFVLAFPAVDDPP